MFNVSLPGLIVNTIDDTDHDMTLEGVLLNYSIDNKNKNISSFYLKSPTHLPDSNILNSLSKF